MAVVHMEAAVGSGSGCVDRAQGQVPHLVSHQGPPSNELMELIPGSSGLLQ